MHDRWVAEWSLITLRLLYHENLKFLKEVNTLLTIVERYVFTFCYFSLGFFTEPYHSEYLIIFHTPYRICGAFWLSAHPITRRFSVEFIYGTKRSRHGSSASTKWRYKVFGKKGTILQRLAIKNQSFFGSHCLLVLGICTFPFSILIYPYNPS